MGDSEWGALLRDVRACEAVVACAVLARAADGDVRVLRSEGEWGHVVAKGEAVGGAGCLAARAAAVDWAAALRAVEAPAAPAAPAARAPPPAAAAADGSAAVSASRGARGVGRSGSVHESAARKAQHHDDDDDDDDDNDDGGGGGGAGGTFLLGARRFRVVSSPASTAAGFGCAVAAERGAAPAGLAIATVPFGAVAALFGSPRLAMPRACAALRGVAAQLK